jgi:hypothetical protein
VCHFRLDEKLYNGGLTPIIRLSTSVRSSVNNDLYHVYSRMFFPPLTHTITIQSPPRPFRNLVLFILYFSPDNTIFR